MHRSLISPRESHRPPYPRLRWILWVVTLVLATADRAPVVAQDAFGPPAGTAPVPVRPNRTDDERPGAADQAVDEAVLADLAIPAAGPQSGPPASVPTAGGIDLFDLALKGGWFMLPIGALSILVVAISLERLMGLRTARVVPAGLVRELERDCDAHTLSTDSAILACSRHPSSLAVVVRHMLMRSGRPLPEVEHAANESAQREMDRLGGPMRWLHLSAAVAPLLGLLGTVWGMIRAFYDTTQLAPGQNKAEYLAEGIYIALVTTLAGLIVAIPAALAAHYFEGKLLRMIRRLEEFAFCLAPAISRAERTSMNTAAANPEAGPRRTRTAGVTTGSP